MSEPGKQRCGYVAIVGRPNVGKSTLFNRITRTRDAIVDDLLTLSRIENKTEKGELYLHIEPICQVLEAAKQTCTVQAEEKQITVAIEWISRSKHICSTAAVNTAYNTGKW